MGSTYFLQLCNYNIGTQIKSIASNLPFLGLLCKPKSVWIADFDIQKFMTVIPRYHSNNFGVWNGMPFYIVIYYKCFSFNLHRTKVWRVFHDDWYRYFNVASFFCSEQKVIMTHLMVFLLFTLISYPCLSLTEPTIMPLHYVKL